MKIPINKLIVLGLTFIPLFFSHYAAAEVGGSFYTPEVDQGEWEIEFVAETRNKRSQDRISGAEIGYGYGVSKYWSTQISVEFQREAGGTTELDAIEWENIFQLTKPGRFPIDIGLLAEINWARDRSEGYEFKWGPLLQKDIGRVQLNANLLFKRQYQAALLRTTQISYQWQAQYRWKPALALGLQGFGEMGDWNDWAPRNEQSHRFGPAIFGKVSLGSDREIEYKLAYLADLSSRARSHGFRIETEYKF